MLLAQGRFWRVGLLRGEGAVVMELRKASLPEELSELRDLRIEVALGHWNRVVRLANADRKLLGGLLLDFARHKGRVGAAVANDRLLAELRRVVQDATTVAIEEGVLSLVVTGGDASA